ncbi:hypothetical protein PTW37_17350 (plasmid) [Arthrobacter agilis]|uniref:hypothetical protein n=1 Tax=Arthrobacter agilis TaxID=37921 RepID=UPI0023660F78|nr:hypothetical protein [Arthrobacter agilis]WDF35163.1 hypothetical protein PTW37_17350 [Arthrobacter agilis]
MDCPELGPHDSTFSFESLLELSTLGVLCPQHLFVPLGTLPCEHFTESSGDG